jgi:transposase
MLTSGVVLLHDNACLHTAAHTRALLEHFNWELFDHQPYSPDIAPSNYHLFTNLKNRLQSQRISSNEELIEDVKTRLSSQVADFFDTGIQKLIPR